MKDMKHAQSWGSFGQEDGGNKWLMGWHPVACATLVFFVSCEPGPSPGEGDSPGENCWLLPENQRPTLSKWWWTWWCRWLCTKEKGTAKGVFSFVIITWYCPFNSWGNSTSRCTASDSYWFEWLSGARLIGPRDWNSDSAARGELTRQSLSVCWRAGFAAVLACPREQGAYLAGWESLPLSCLRIG